MNEFGLMLIFIALVLIIYVLGSEVNSLSKMIGAQTPTLTRYIEACRWVAGLNVSALDIDCYAHQQRSAAMAKWEQNTGKNPLVINNFRDYVNYCNSVV